MWFEVEVLKLNKPYPVCRFRKWSRAVVFSCLFFYIRLKWFRT